MTTGQQGLPGFGQQKGPLGKDQPAAPEVTTGQQGLPGSDPPTGLLGTEQPLAPWEAPEVTTGRQGLPGFGQQTGLQGTEQPLAPWEGLGRLGLSIPDVPPLAQEILTRGAGEQENPGRLETLWVATG